MPKFSSPGPVTASIEVAAGDVHITASDRDDTVVEVAPRDAGRAADVRSAEQTRVEFSDGRLHVRSPKRGFTMQRGGIVDITVALPTASKLTGHTGMGDLRTDGTLADCSFKSGAGEIAIQSGRQVRVISGVGDIRIDEATGDAQVVTGAGGVRIGALAGSGIIKSGSGAAAVGDARGTLRISTASGDITIDRAAETVVAKTAKGNVRVGSVSNGAVALETAYGDIEIGIAQGAAAKLDVKTDFGRVSQELTPSDAPPREGQRVTVRGRTHAGDITVRRAS